MADEARPKDDAPDATQTSSSPGSDSSHPLPQADIPKRQDAADDISSSNIPKQPLGGDGPSLPNREQLLTGMRDFMAASKKRARELEELLVDWRERQVQEEERRRTFEAEWQERRRQDDERWRQQQSEQRERMAEQLRRDAEQRERVSKERESEAEERRRR